MESYSDHVVLDLNWTEQDINVDVRESDPASSCQRINPTINLSGAAFASPAKYFLHFLPCEHIKRVVIPAINQHAGANKQSWLALDWSQYLAWIKLYIKRTVITCRDRRVYWQTWNCPYFLNVDFGDYMDMHRLNDITNWHIFSIQMINYLMKIRCIKTAPSLLDLTMIYQDNMASQKATRIELLTLAEEASNTESNVILSIEAL
ncbi:unnamed protein product [Absidia cylindrospora]